MPFSLSLRVTSYDPNFLLKEHFFTRSSELVRQ